MCFVRIWCLPSSLKDKAEEIQKAINQTLVDISELGLNESQITLALFTSDFTQINPPKKVIVEITGLCQKSECTTGIIQKITKGVGEAVKTFCPEIKVECFAFFMDPAAGFWSSDEMDSRFITNSKLKSILKLLQTPIEEMNLSVRAFNCLHNYGITTAGAVIILPHVRELNIRNYGISTEVNTLNALKEMGFSEKEITFAKNFGKKKIEEAFGKEYAYKQLVDRLKNKNAKAVRFVESLPVWTLLPGISPKNLLPPKNQPASFYDSEWYEVSVQFIEDLLRKKLEHTALAIHTGR